MNCPEENRMLRSGKAIQKRRPVTGNKRTQTVSVISDAPAGLTNIVNENPAHIHWKKQE
jgi:hypothetical protein